MGEGITGLARLAALVVTARVLGPTSFGFLNIGLVVGGYLIAAHAGLDVIGTRDASRRPPKDIGPLAARLVGLQLTIAAVVFLVTAALVLTLPIEELSRKLILLFALSLFTIACDVRWLFVALHRTAPVAVAASVSALAYLGGVVILVRQPGDVLWVPVVHVGSELLMAALLMMISRRRVGAWRPRFDRAARRTWRPLIFESLPIASAKAARGVTLSFDIIVVGLLRPAADVGYYGAARRLSLVALIFLGLYTNSFLPLVARAVEAGYRRANRVLAVAVRRTALVLVPGAVVGTVFAPTFLRYMVGPEYTQGANALRVLIWSLVVACFAGLYSQVMLAFRRQTLLLVIDIVSAAVSVALSFVLVPTVGLVGAALAALLAKSVTLVWTVAAARPLLAGRTGVDVAASVPHTGAESGLRTGPDFPPVS